MKRFFWGSSAALTLAVLLACGGGLDSSSTDAEIGPESNTDKVAVAPGETASSAPAEATDGDRKLGTVGSPDMVVSEDIYNKLVAVSSHRGFLAERLVDLRRKALGCPEERTCQAALASAINRVQAEADFMVNNIPNSAPDPARQAVEEWADIVREDAREITAREPRTEELTKHRVDSFNRLRREEKEDLPKPPIELVGWTEERVKKFLNIPQAAKFGWFPSVTGRSGNRAALVDGTLKAYNAFNVETRHEFQAFWLAEETKEVRTWELVRLRIDDKIAYLNPDYVARLEKLLSKTIAEANVWEERRRQVSRSIEGIDVAIAEMRARISEAAERRAEWERESHLFTAKGGHKLQARILSSTGPRGNRTVKLQKQDGSTVSVKTDQLIGADRDYIQQFIERRRKGR